MTARQQLRDSLCTFYNSRDFLLNFKFMVTFSAFRVTGFSANLRLFKNLFAENV